MEKERSGCCLLLFEMTRWRGLLLLLTAFCGVSLFLLYSQHEMMTDVRTSRRFEEQQVIKQVDDDEAGEAGEADEQEVIVDEKWYLKVKPGDCSPLERRCDEAWKHWLLNGNITRVRDPPECCRPWHAFDMFTIEYAEGYRGILKVRKHSEMTSDVVGHHVERLLGLNMTVPVFSWALSEEGYRALVGGLRDAGVTADDGRRRRERG